MSGDVAALTADMMPYLSAAASAYGGAVLATVRDEAADATVGLGRRLLLRIFGSRTSGEELPEPLADVIANPDDEDAAAALRLAVRKALQASPGLQSEVEDLLTSTGIKVTAAGERSISGQTISGVAITGDPAGGIFVTGGQPQFTVNLGAGETATPHSSTEHNPERVVQISSLLPPGAGSIIRDRTFENIKFVGPAIISPMSNVSFEHCGFGLQNNLDELLWEITLPRFVVGVIGLERCTFRRCSFNTIGLMGPREFLDEFKRMVDSAQS